MVQLLVSPDGTLTNVPDNQVEDAIKDGFTKAPETSYTPSVLKDIPEQKEILAVSPTGVLTKLAPEEAEDAFKDGFTPYEDIANKTAEINKTYQNIKKGEIHLPGDEQADRLPFSRAVDQIRNFITGDKPIPANPNLQDENGNYKLFDENKNPVLVPHTDIAKYLLQNPNAEFRDHNLQINYLARLQKSEEEKENHPNIEAFGQGLLNRDILGGLIPAPYKDFIADPLVSPAAKLNIIADTVADSKKATNTFTESLSRHAGAFSTDVLTHPLAEIGGGVARGLMPEATSVLGGIGKAAVIGGSEMAAFTAPEVINQAFIDKDPLGAAETLAFNVIAGGGISGIMKAGGDLTSAMINLRNNSSIKSAATSTANKAMASALNQTEAELAKFGNNESNIPVQEEAARRYKVLTDYIEETSNKKLSELKASEFKNIVKELDNDVGPRVGKIIKELDSTVAANKLEEHLPDVNNIAIKLNALKDKTILGEYGAPLRAEVDKALNTLEEVAAKGNIKEATFDKPGEAGTAEKLSFDELQQLKVSANHKAKWQQTETNDLNNIKQQIALVFKNELDKAAEEVAQKAGNVKLTQEWTKYKELYKIAKDLETPVSRIKESGSIFKDYFSLGNAAAYSAGHAISPPGLGHLGGVGAIAIKKLAESWLHENSITKIASTLRKLTDSAKFGSYVAVDAAKILDYKLAEIPKKMIRSEINQNVPNMIKYLLGNEANGLSKDQQFHRFADHITATQANPQLANTQIKTIAAPVSHFHPEVGKLFEDNLDKTYKYIYDVMPKPTNSRQPFTKEGKWKPSASELNDFNKVLAVISDPFRVIDELKAGTLTNKQVAAFSELNPGIKVRVQEELYKLAYSNKVDLTYQQKLSAALLMGQDLDTGINKVPAFQQVYATAAQSTDPVPKKPSRGGSKGLDISKMPTAQYTPIQRLNK